MDSCAARGTLETRGSPARDLRGVRNGVRFLALLLLRLLPTHDSGNHGSSSANDSLRAAARAAYAEALAPYHTLVVRSAVAVGILALPSREAFLAAVGEDEAGAAEAGARIEAATKGVLGALSGLFEGATSLARR